MNNRTFALLCILVFVFSSCRTVHSIFDRKKEKVDSTSETISMTQKHERIDSAIYTTKRDTSNRLQQKEYTRRITITTYPKKEGDLLIGTEGQMFWDSLHATDPESLIRVFGRAGAVITIDENGHETQYDTRQSTEEMKTTINKDTKEGAENRQKTTLQAQSTETHKKREVKTTDWKLYAAVGSLVLMVGIVVYVRFKTKIFSFIKNRVL